MASLHKLRIFVNERLAAAAEEIFGAVERTLLEYQNAVCLSDAGDKSSATLTFTGGLMPEEKPSAAFKEEIKFSPTQDSSGSEFPGAPAHRFSPGQQTHGESGESFGLSQSRDRDVHPSTSAENWVRTGEDGSEVLHPLNNTADTEVTESRQTDRESQLMQQHSRLNLSTSQRTNQGRLDCQLRGQSFHCYSYLNKHMKSHTHPIAVHPNFECSAQSQTEPPVKYSGHNLCFVCGKTFTTRTHLKRHLLVHTGQKPHCCQECGKRFSRRECLHVHMRVHSVEKPYTCEVCGRGFKQRSNMMCHMRTHTGQKPHPCVICSRTFTHKEDMLRHMEVHAVKS